MALSFPPKNKGMKRTFEECGDCGKVMFHDYIPFGISRPMEYDSCLCRLTGQHPKVKRITRKQYEKLWRQQRRRELREMEAEDRA